MKKSFLRLFPSSSKITKYPCFTAHPLDRSPNPSTHPRIYPPIYRPIYCVSDAWTDQASHSFPPVLARLSFWPQIAHPLLPRGMANRSRPKWRKCILLPSRIINYSVASGMTDCTLVYLLTIEKLLEGKIRWETCLENKGGPSKKEEIHKTELRPGLRLSLRLPERVCPAPRVFWLDWRPDQKFRGNIEV